jgi:hypothetical protein
MQPRASHSPVLSILRQPRAHLGFMVDVVLAGDVDDDLFDRATGELEGATVGVVGCHRRSAVAADADAVADEAERAGLGDDRT